MFPTTGEQAHPDRIAVDPTTGNLYAIAIGEFGNAGSLLLVGPDSFTEISARDKFIGCNGIAVKPDGTVIYIPTIASFGVLAARILSVDLTDPTGAQSVLTEGLNLSLVAGLRVFQDSGGTGNPPPSPSSPALLLDHRQTDDASLDWRGTSVTALPQIQLPQQPSQPLPLSRIGADARSTVRRAATQLAVDSFFVERFLLAATVGERDPATTFEGASPPTHPYGRG